MFQTLAQQGWQCPICGYVYSPNCQQCYNCNRPENLKYTVSTNTEIIGKGTCHVKINEKLEEEGNE